MVYKNDVKIDVWKHVLLSNYINCLYKLANINVM